MSFFKKQLEAAAKWSEPKLDAGAFSSEKMTRGGMANEGSWKASTLIDWYCLEDSEAATGHRRYGCCDLLLMSAVGTGERGGCIHTRHFQTLD